MFVPASLIAMSVRAHPTVRPFALGLGVFPRPSVTEQLSFLGPTVAQDLSEAILLDTLGALTTFPVRHRVVFGASLDSVEQDLKLPATWRELHQRGATPAARLASAAEDILAMGAEAVLLLSADGPAMQLGALFDGLMWLLPKKRVLVGHGTRGLSSLGVAEPLTWLEPAMADLGADVGFGLADEGPNPVGPARVMDAARDNGFEVQELPSTYRIDGKDGLNRLFEDVAKGAFAPLCRKMFERRDVLSALGRS